MSDHVSDPRALLESIAQALRAMPGAVALYAFGSLAQGRGDEYSDIDLTLLSTDVDASLAARHTVLSQVEPIALEWRIVPSRDRWAATYLFVDVSPYHKLDLGISASGSDVDGVLLWQREGELQGVTAPPAIPAPFMPVPGSVEHHAADQLLGLTRYAKARRRDNQFLCWRFASALLEATLTTLHARECGVPFTGRKLATSEYLELDTALAPEARARVLDRLRFSPASAMDRSVRWLVDDMLEASADLVDGPVLPDSLAAQFLTFLDAELGPVDGTNVC